MKKSALLAAPALALAAVTLPATTATAAESWSFQAELAPVNNSTAAGSAVVDVTGQEATVTVEVAGAPALFQGAPYPHAQHIHIGGQGVCAPPSADAPHRLSQRGRSPQSCSTATATRRCTRATGTR